MLAGLERDIHTCHATNFAPPHSGAINHHVTVDMTRAFLCLVIHAGDPPPIATEPRDFGLFRNHRSALPGPFGHGKRDIAGSPCPSLSM